MGRINCYGVAEIFSRRLKNLVILIHGPQIAVYRWYFRLESQRDVDVKCLMEVLISRIVVLQIEEILACGVITTCHA